MMGTEDRKGPNEFIPMSNQIYEFILFRSLDIKDLQVCEAPIIQQQQPQMGFVDPAIVQSSNITYQASPQHAQSGAWQQPKLQFGTSTTQVAAQYQNYGGYGAAPSLQFGNANSGYYGQQNQSSMTQQQYHQVPPPQSFAPQTQQEAEPSKMAPALQAAATAPPKVHPEAASNVISLTPKADKKEEAKVLSYSTETKRAQMIPKPLSYASMVSQGKNESSQLTSSHHQRTGSFRPPANNHHRQIRNHADFNFESSQAGMQNLSSAQAEVLKFIQDKTFYKKSSFFDDISCDNKDVGKNEDLHMKNERSWNVETFGVAAPPSSGYHRGSSSRGRGGRGGYRGGNRGRGGSRT